MNIYHVLALVFPYSAGFKGARVLNTLYALELGAGPLTLGVLLAMYAVFPLLLAVYSGKICDRYGVRVPMLAGMACVVTGVLLPYAVPTLPALFVSAAIIGAGFIFVQVPTQSLTGSLGKGEERTRNFNLYALVIAVADFVGPVLAGFLIDYAGYARTYLVLSAFGIVSVTGVIWLFRRIPRTPPREGERKNERMMDLLRDRNLRRVYIASATVMTGLDLFQLYLPLYGHSIKLSASAIGMVMGAFAAAAFVVRMLLPWLARRFGEERTLIGALFVAAATFVLIPLFSNAIMLGLVCFALGLSLGVGQPLGVLLTYNASPAGRAGEALGTRLAINNVIHIVMPVGFGAVGSLVGLPFIFWIASIMLASGGYAARARGAA